MSLESARGLGGARSSPGRALEKTKIISEMASTLSRDPTSVRFLRRWIRTLRPGHGPLGDRLPWMNFKAISWLDTYLRPSMTAFEYGAGGSTVFVAKRVHSLVSVESESLWRDKVSGALGELGITNCDLRFVPPDGHIPAVDAAGSSNPYVSTAKGVAGGIFETYVRTIDGFPDRSFDLVLVDGYARLACIRHALPKVRPGGYLLVDDTDWPKYKRSIGMLRTLPRTDFVGVTPFQRNLRQTSVWRVP